jgi:hypothetical protein
MGVSTGKPQSGCPVNHSKAILGACSICKKTVCEDCTSPIKNQGRLLCKFCYFDMRVVDKTVKDNVAAKSAHSGKGFIGRLLDKLLGRTVDLEKANVQTDCSVNAHVKPVVSTCSICKKTVCENCIARTKVGVATVCKKCHHEFFEVKQVEAEEKSKGFWGGVLGFLALIYYIIRIGLIIALIFVAILGIIVGVFYEFYAQDSYGFSYMADDWKSKEYTRVVTEDMGIVLEEIRDRFFCYFVYEKPYVSPYAEPEETMEVQLDKHGQPMKDKNGKPIMVPKKAPGEATGKPGAK